MCSTPSSDRRDVSRTRNVAVRCALDLMRAIDEIDIHIAPVLLGDGIRLYDKPGRSPLPLTLINGDAGRVEVGLRYRPTIW